MKKYFTLALGLSLLTPSLVLAKASDLGGLMTIIIGLIKQATYVVATLALLFFFWGLAKFIMNVSDETKRAEGKSIMVWGIIALFVMIAVWGLVGILENTFFGSGGARGPASGPAGSSGGGSGSYFTDDKSGRLFYTGSDEEGVIRTGPVDDSAIPGGIEQYLR